MKIYFLFCVTFFLLLKYLNACSCSYKTTLQHYCQSDFVAFIKTRLSTEDHSQTSLIYDVEVKKILKANDAAKNAFNKTIKWRWSTKLSTICYRQFATNVTYVVAGRVRRDQIHVNLCDYAAKLDSLSKEERLGFQGVYSKFCNAIR